MARMIMSRFRHGPRLSIAVPSLLVEPPDSYGTVTYATVGKSARGSLGPPSHRTSSERRLERVGTSASLGILSTVALEAPVICSRVRLVAPSS